MTVVSHIDKYQCEKCGVKKSLVFHHDSYDPEVIIVLCRSCHRKLHGSKKVRPDNFISAVVKPEDMKNISVVSTTKQRFDRVQATESAGKGRNITQTETMNILLDLWEQKEAGVLKVVEA